MKTLSLISILFFCTLSSASQSILELNQHNLTMLALNQSKDEAINDYALAIARKINGKAYFKAFIQKDKVKIQEFVDIEKKKLKLQITTAAKNPLLKRTKTVTFDTFNEPNSTINIKKFVTGTLESMFRSYKKNKGLPDYYFLLFANTEIFNNIKVDANEFKKLMTSRKNLTTKDKKNLYVEATLIVPKFQNHQEFQIVIKSIEVYESKNKKILLAKKTESRTTNDVINSWLLSDGYTNPLIAIHGFLYQKYRLHELMEDGLYLKEFCKKTIKKGIHQIVVCAQPYTENTEFIITYLGGRIAQVDIIAKTFLNTAEKIKIKKDIKQYLKKQSTIFQIQKSKWTKYLIDFEFYSDLFQDKPKMEPQYKFLYNAISNPVEPKCTLILSMISQATKKLLEENK